MSLRTWHIGTLDECETLPDTATTREYRSSWYHGHESGYSSNVVDVSVHEDGAVSLSAEHSESFIYLYPEQVQHLEKILLERKGYVKKS